MEFEYQAVDPGGNITTGKISASSLKEARDILKERNFTILELKEKKEKTAGFSFIKKISTEELYSFFKELAILLKAGLTIDKALQTIISSTSNPMLSEASQKILKDLKEGKSISESFKKTNIFNEFIQSMIESGESIGNIVSAFENIADYLKFQIQFKSEIKNALAYPVFLVIASFTTLIVVFKFILPRFFSIFGQTSLPLPAKILMGAGKIFSGANFYILLGLALFYIILVRMGKIPSVIPHLWRFAFRIPIIKKLMLYLDYTRFCYSMHSMLKSGIDFVDSLYLSKNLVRNKELQSFLESSIYEIRKGRSISEVFSASRTLPEIFYNMIKVGEESGNLKEIFLELHFMYEEKFKSSVKKLISLLEPSIITITGIIVGFIVISLILTVMSAGVIKL